MQLYYFLKLRGKKKKKKKGFLTHWIKTMISIIFLWDKYTSNIQLRKPELCPILTELVKHSAAGPHQ